MRKEKRYITHITVYWGYWELRGWGYHIIACCIGQQYSYMSSRFMFLQLLDHVITWSYLLKMLSNKYACISFCAGAIYRNNYFSSMYILVEIPSGGSRCRDCAEALHSIFHWHRKQKVKSGQFPSNFFFFFFNPLCQKRINPLGGKSQNQWWRY